MLLSENQKKYWSYYLILWICKTNVINDSKHVQNLWQFWFLLKLLSYYNLINRIFLLFTDDPYFSFMFNFRKHPETVWAPARSQDWTQFLRVFKPPHKKIFFQLQSFKSTSLSLHKSFFNNSKCRHTINPWVYYPCFLATICIMHLYFFLSNFPCNDCMWYMSWNHYPAIVYS